MCIKSIENKLIKKAYEEIETRRISELTTFRACIGTRIYGEACIHDIAEDKVNLAKQKADEVIKGIVCKILFHSFKILLLSIFLASIIYAFYYYISPIIIENDNEIYGSKIMMAVIIYGSVLLYVYYSIQKFIYEKYNFIKQQIADAAS
jgi:hypothetical protein